MKELKTLIVDDDSINRKLIENLLIKFCPQIDIVAKCKSAEEARYQLEKNDIQLMFLDVKMPTENGFQLINSLSNRSFEVIFITAYKQYALEALKINALDYILKPIDYRELMIAVGKVTKALENRKKIKPKEEIRNISNQINTDSPVITLPTKDGANIIKINDILYIEASGNYCIIFTKNDKEFIVSKTLKDFDEILEDKNFIRIHKSYLVNKQSVTSYIRSNGIKVKLKNGKLLPVSRRKQALFFSTYSSN